MHENMFVPLGMTNSTISEDLGFSCFSTAADFAKLGQILLNRGAYGETSFLWSRIFDQVLLQAGTIRPTALGSTRKGMLECSWTSEN